METYLWRRFHCQEHISLIHYELLLRRIVEQLQAVRGLRAIVLGGSYASGSQRPDSDLDIGLYYQDDNSLDIPTRCATRQALHTIPSLRGSRQYLF
jgi:predicted nucleotidyltransferase